MTGYSIAIGSCSALDSLVSQAYGAKAYKLMGLHCQRAMVILSIAVMIAISIWCQTEFILHTILGIEKDTAKLAGLWAKHYAIGLWPAVMFEILRKFLQCQQLIWPIVVSALTAAITNLFLSYILVYSYDLGYIGCVTGYVTSQWISLITLSFIVTVYKYVIHSYKNGYQRVIRLNEMDTSLSAAFTVDEIEDDKFDANSSHGLIEEPSDETEGHAIKIFAKNKSDSVQDKDATEAEEEAEDPDDNWPPLSTEIFSDWWPFLRIGLPSGLSLFIEWGSYEATAVIVGRLGTVSLATHGIFSALAPIMYMTPISIAISSATLAGNMLGEGLAERAWHMVALGMWSDLVVGIIQGTLLFVLGPYWVHAFTTDTDVVSLVQSTLPVFMLYIIADDTKCGSLNLLRSTGNPAVTVWGNAIICYAFMVPLAYLLAFPAKMGIEGPWLAMTISWMIMIVLYSYVLWKTDWQQQADNAQKLAKGNRVTITPNVSYSSSFDESEVSAHEGHKSLCSPTGDKDIELIELDES
eukprot:CAMPEP_0182418716 /NCGR_PEP_ID=MMETSP1167-20130531/3085_1 /TAXON_ID=2988 /ORGANISM="Mallomonas Sp, Strain CCMP3275" /LENGTH=522 /DNA_ID=CAMNT_0024593049 /DNA_START=341 /DNA_END=1909 /DNA_ORIENTATION=+